MKNKADLAILAVSNFLLWFAKLPRLMASAEPFLKDVLLVISIGYALHRWIRFARGKKNDDAGEIEP